MSTSKAVDKSGKKLKQACLPFKLISSPGEDTNSKCRKRKLSGAENEDTRLQSSKVELLNGGTKCFIKSDDENNKPCEVINDNINETVPEESLNSIISTSEIIIEKINNEINDEDLTKIDKNVKIVEEIYISSESDNSNNVSVDHSSGNGKLELSTPSPKAFKRKHLIKKQESAKKQEEKLRLKQEKEKAREEKLREQTEKQRLRELERKHKEEEKKAKELEKERDKKQKEEERKAKELEKEKEKKQREEERKAKESEKEKEKKQREEERKAKESEKEKQKEEKRLREELEKKKSEKVKAAFVGFFKPKCFNLDTSKKDEEIIDQKQETYFMPFQTKQDMKIAPFCRVYLNSDKKKIIDKCMSQYEENKDLLYLNLLRTGKHKPSKSEATWPDRAEDDEDVIIIESGSANDDEAGVNEIGIRQKTNSPKCHWKLLQFDENKRPPYWGTWRKKSLYVKPRRPFACDKIMFDYEIDSDDEWEDEGPGESLHGTDDEEEPEDDYEVDNDVFVPHGYLSDEEGDLDNNNASEEAQKEKLKLLGEEFEAEIKKKTERIKPRLVGCIWIPNNVTNPENVSKAVAETLLKSRCIWDDEEPIITETPNVVDSSKDLNASENKKTPLLPDSIIPELIKFIHANTNGIKSAAQNFKNDLDKNGRHIGDNSISLNAVRNTIKNIATKTANNTPWYVSKENFVKFGVEYPKNFENEFPKPSKSSVKKITSFMTPQSQKAKSIILEKKCTETEHNLTEFKDSVEECKSSFVPTMLFDNKDSPLKSVKEEQKINIIGGKKRITPILLSPKKAMKSVVDKKPSEKTLVPEVEVVCQETSTFND